MFAPDEFWVRGHMPGFPLLPGVLMCEAAAQLGAYYLCAYRPFDGDFLGFGGMDNVRFRGKVSPGDRLVLIAKGCASNPGKVCLRSRVLWAQRWSSMATSSACPCPSAASAGASWRRLTVRKSPGRPGITATLSLAGGGTRAPLDWRKVFGNDRPVELEIGFGKGLFLVTAAAACADVNFAGIEIVRKYQLFAATRVAKRGLKTSAWPAATPGSS